VAWSNPGYLIKMIIYKGAVKMESTQKHFLIDNFLTSLVCKDRQKTVRNNQCMTCSGDADTFTDELSVKEYRISGMCQSCQDKVFVDL